MVPIARDPKRSKSYGYEAEIIVRNALQELFPQLTRTGSIAYKRAAADLVQHPLRPDPVLIVATRDKGFNYTLVTLSIDDLGRLMLYRSLDDVPVAVQVKARTQTAVGGWWRALRKAVRK